jgi:hypothetical protein
MEDVLERPCSWEVLRMLIDFEDPGELSGFIEVIRDAEMACSLEMQNLDQQMRLERQGALGGASCIGLIVHAEESVYWNGRISWLQASRAYLEKQQQRREAATSRDREGEL